MALKLYHISQRDNTGYDTYDAAVVCAENEEAAQLINPYGTWGGAYTAWCTTPDWVTVRYLGEAGPDVQPGIVLASFNAG